MIARTDASMAEVLNNFFASFETVNSTASSLTPPQHQDTYISGAWSKTHAKVSEPQEGDRPRWSIWWGTQNVRGPTCGSLH